VKSRYRKLENYISGELSYTFSMFWKTKAIAYLHHLARRVIIGGLPTKENIVVKIYKLKIIHVLCVIYVMK